MKKNAQVSQFPHFFRVIPELLLFYRDSLLNGLLRKRLRQIMLWVLMGGICLFVVLNVLYQAMLPVQFKELLGDPFNTGLLSRVYLNSRDASLRQSVYLQLQYRENVQILSQIEAIESSDREKINKLKELLSSTPNFPDARAYLATLYLKDRNCSEALSQIQQAQRLDPNRKEFEVLAESIRRCK